MASVYHMKNSWKGFNRTLSRGPDATKVVEIDQCVLGSSLIDYGN